MDYRFRFSGAVLLVVTLLLSISAAVNAGTVQHSNIVKGFNANGFSTADLKQLWQYNATAGLNYTAIGNMFNDGRLGFLVYYNEGSTEYFSGVNSSGAVMWNLQVSNFINFTLYGRVGGYGNTILVQSGVAVGAGSAVLTLYAASNGTKVWSNTVGLAGGEGIYVYPVGFNMGTAGGAYNSTIVVTSTNYSGSLPGTSVYENTVRLLDPVNGSFVWSSNFTTAGVANMQMTLMFHILPPVPGLSGGGILYNIVNYQVSGFSVSFTSRLVMLNSAGSVVFNITTPTSSSSVVGYTIMDAVGNYNGSSSYDIALSIMDMAYSASGSSIYGSLVVMDTAGHVIYENKYGTNTTILLEQSMASQIGYAYYKLPPATPVGPLIDYTGAGYPDLVYVVVTSSGSKISNGIGVLNVKTATVLWSDQIQQINSPMLAIQLSTGINGDVIPDLIVMPLNGGMPYPVIAINGKNGTIMWKIMVDGSPFDQFGGFESVLMSFNGVPDFINVSGSTSGSLQEYNVSAINGNTGKDMYTTKVTLSSPAPLFYVYPIGDVNNDGIQDFAVYFESVGFNGSQSSIQVYGFSGQTGSIIFKITVNGTGYMEVNAEGGSFWSIFYPGLNNGQLGSSSSAYDLLVSTSSSLYAEEVTTPSATLSVSLSATPSSGVSPLNVTFTATVTGGISPYAYTWIPMGNGTTQYKTTSQSFSYNYTAGGSYYAGVTVSDAASNTGSSYILINVKPASTNNTTGHTTSYYKVYGVVIYNGTGMAGVYITVLNSAGISVNSTQTGSNGMFTVYLQNGTFELKAAISGYQAFEKNFTVNSGSVNLGSISLTKLSTSPPPTTTTSSTANVASSAVLWVVVAVIVIVVVALLLLLVRRKRH